jgi:hypothetical protein
MLEQYPAKPHPFIRGMTTQRLIPLPQGHQLSVNELRGEFEIAILDPDGDLLSHPLFGGNEIFRPRNAEEVERIISKLMEELA